MTTGKAALFRALHSSSQTGEPLLLANSWDVASACIAEAAGARAVATTSAGVAWGLGAPDGDRLDRDRALDLVARVAAAVEVPVSADLESGFASTPEGVAETVERALEAGAVGINLEDGTRPIEEQCARIAAARKAGAEFFLNARIDTFLTGRGLDSTLQRATAYLEAGADGVFVPGVVDPETVSALVEGISAPVNVMAGPGAPPVAELAALGVARISLGSAVSQAAYAVADRATRELLTSGTYTALAESFDYGELNKLLS